MLKNFSEAFDGLIDNRLSDIGEHLYCQNQEYKKVSKKLNDAYEKVRLLLSESERALVLEIAECETELVGIMEKIIYSQGIKDGVEMKNGVMGVTE